ncbi:MAG: hypothetical protein P8P36_02700 [Akkermansiaceae bacterium]|nr:hypothetical protein [Akkermansiaceae bacterium]
MMNKYPITLFVTLFFALVLPCIVTSPAFADQDKSDKGKEVVGKIKATLYLGSHNELEEWAKDFAMAGEDMTARLRGIPQLKFKHYRKLGTDVQPVFRSYENWLAPLKPSEEILLSFESRGRSGADGLRLDLEFWQQRRKIMQMNPVLNADKPLLILGPRWRGCSMIIAIELID